MSNIEEKRITAEYMKRDNDLSWSDWRTNIYHPRHPVGHHFQEHNHNILVDTLNILEINLSNKRILDVGCGFGSWLRYLVELGASPSDCVGIDLSPLRIEVATQKNPSIKWLQHSISDLPFSEISFDIVLQTVVFSSILDPEMRKSAAAEMFRVTKKGGVIFWIDLCNVTSEKLMSFSESDVHSLFPNMEIIIKKQVHPKYFRRLNGKNAWLAETIYHFTKSACESMLLVLKKTHEP